LPIPSKHSIAFTVASFIALATLAHGQNSVETAARTAAKVRIGFAIAPVALDTTGKNPDLVGYGSYLVNAAAGCADCHSSGPASTFAAGRSPYGIAQFKQINPSVYLGGGRDFGPFANLEHLYSRNVTPDKSGRPAGLSFNDFVTVMRTGKDFAKLHPSCIVSLSSNCLIPPLDGFALQIMPWPFYQDLDDYDLLAIYQYLSAIPCIAGPADKNDPLHHDCN
jgi:hypothetical protein